MIQQDYQNFLITLGILILLILITKTVSKYTHIKRITLRNLLHLCVGIACSFSVFYFKTNKYPIVLALIFLILNSYNLFFKKDILKVEPKNRDSFGTIYFPISFIIHTLFFWNHKYYFLLSFLILSISDPLASFFGKYLGGKKSLYSGTIKKHIMVQQPFLYQHFYYHFILEQMSLIKKLWKPCYFQFLYRLEPLLLN